MNSLDEALAKEGWNFKDGERYDSSEDWYDYTNWCSPDCLIPSVDGEVV